MAKQNSIFSKIFKEHQLIEAGNYQTTKSTFDDLNYRLHLRIEKDGTGILIVNASTVLHLNETATEYAFYMVKNMKEDEIATKISKRYRGINKTAALDDYITFKSNIENLLFEEDLDPVQFMGIEEEKNGKDLAAPFRLDCAVTYTTSKSVDDPRIPHNRVSQYLTTSEWKKIFSKAAENGIPHILFTGGEPTQREDLIELLQYCEELGLVTGLLTDGKQLSDSEYLQKVLNAGLDHTLIILQPEDEESWESLSSFAYWKEALDEDIYIAVHLTITQENQSSIDKLINKIAKSGVHSISLSTNDITLQKVLKEAEDLVFYLGIELTSDMPVPFSELNPISLSSAEDFSTVEQEFGKKIVKNEKSSLLALYIEPDGDVTKSQIDEKVFGNFLTDEFETIWKSVNS